MVDVSKIDKFFNGERPFSEVNNKTLNSRVKVLRLAKLLMPSIAAAIVGFIMVFPSLKDDKIVAKTDITMPKKGELEKLHVEKTVFSIINDENQVSIIKADSLDETQSGSKIIKINNINGKLPAGKNGDAINLEAKIGYYNQNKSHIKVLDNVKAIYSDGTTLLTQSAEYDFNNSFGYGNDDIYAYGNWGKLWAQSFKYYQKDEILLLIGKSKVVNEDNVLIADKTIKYYRLLNVVEANDNVKVITPDSTLYADKMKSYLSSDGKLNIKQIEAYGNVKVVDNENTLYADKMKAIMNVNTKTIEQIEAYGNVKVVDNENTLYADKMKAIINVNTKTIEQIEAYDNVKIVTVDGIAKGNYAIYELPKHKIELVDNVSIEKDGNVIYGQKAVTDLKTSISKIITSDKNKQRVSGVIKGTSIKEQKNEKK
ncbi:MAG: hypothetical protein IJW75_02015 [Alphaproteobacteria bacterium]|nr:hypothetical protein [Alphaproteobacteria bacterium]